MIRQDNDKKKGVLRAAHPQQYAIMTTMPSELFVTFGMIGNQMATDNSLGQLQQQRLYTDPVFDTTTMIMIMGAQQQLTQLVQQCAVITLHANMAQYWSSKKFNNNNNNDEMQPNDVGEENGKMGWKKMWWWQ